MKRSLNSDLNQELQAAGAKPEDAAQLVALATGITRLKTTGPQLAPSRSSRQSHFQWWPLLPAAAGGLFAGLILVALAQTSFPGSWLYPVKRASETVALQTQPAYRGVVMMRRAQEVRELVTTNANPSLVTSTLHDYATDAVAYQAQSTENYAAFRYCQSNLQQAESQARGSERQEIAATLASLPADSD